MARTSTCAWLGIAVAVMALVSRFDGEFGGTDVAHVQQQAVVLGQIPSATRRFQNNARPRRVVLAVDVERHS